MTTPEPAERIKCFESYAYGMFVHWGLYSLLGRGEWALDVLKPPAAEYICLKEKFTAEDFDAPAIARLAREAGMRYIVLTSRHHDGFSLYDTHGLNDYDAPHSAAHRDLVAEFVEGCWTEGIVPFFYHTTLDWYQDSFKNDFASYLDYLYASIEILCRNYGPLGGLWFDGDWSRDDVESWQWDKRYSLIRKYQPDAMIINNTGLSNRGQVCHPEIDCVTFERGRPELMNRDGMKKYVASEMCQTFNCNWGIATDDFCYLSPKDIIEDLCASRKTGANLLLNIGPTGSGAIPEYETAVLKRVGRWITKYVDAIYNGKPCGIEGQDGEFGLESNGKLYLFVRGLKTSGDANVVLSTGSNSKRVFSGIRRPVGRLRWIDNDQRMSFCHDPETGVFEFEPTLYPYGVNLVVRIAELV